MPELENPTIEQATFAGGCFWCIESAFSHLPGVVKTVSGLTGGSIPNPSYEVVHTQETGYYEAVRVWFDPIIISYERLLEIFWMQIDPTDPDGQFADRGSVYRTAIFYHSSEQKTKAEKSKTYLGSVQKYQRPIVTKIIPAGDFYEAPEYHQQFAKKYPLRYQLYRRGSGRHGYLSSTWGKSPLKLPQ